MNPTGHPTDKAWMTAAAALAERSRLTAAPNPNIACLLVAAGRLVGRGWTQPGGRPHAEAMALSEAGDAAKGATAYVTLEPCAHVSARGPACSDLLIAAGVARVVSALQDPDPRTAGKGFSQLEAAGIAVTTNVEPDRARSSMASWWSRVTRNRPYISLKLALSLDGQIAHGDGSSRWITGQRARAHGHLERARHHAILVGRRTWQTDSPRLDVRIPGLETRSPKRLLLTHGTAPDGWTAVASPQHSDSLAGIDSILIEGGAGAAAAFLAADRVDRLLLYRAPILIGSGRAALGGIGLVKLEDAHGRWRQSDSRTLGSDRLDVYDRVRED